MQTTPIVGAQQESDIVVDNAAVGVGETARVGLNLSAAPNGLTGYSITVSLDTPAAANITAASVSDEFGPAALQSVSIAEDNNSVEIKATDATQNIGPGTTNIPLGSITVRGEAAGQTSVSVSVGLMQDDENPPQQIFPGDSSGTVTVDGPNQAPTADAGLDQTVTGGTDVELDGSDSSDPDEGDTLSYAWEQTAGPDVTLSDADTATPTFTAPAVEFETDFIFELTTTDESGEQDVDSVVVVVEAGNEAPTADAGIDQTVTEGDTVDLDATGSTDTDTDSDQLSYAWEQTAGLDVTLSGADTATPSLTAPDTETETTLTFAVEVDDGVTTDTDTVDITVEPAATGGGGGGADDPNQPPTADAGENPQPAAPGTIVELDGTNSLDPDDDDLTYEWQQSVGPDADIADADTTTPEVTIPDRDESDRVVCFRLFVRDGDDELDTDEVCIYISPTANAGADQTVTEGDTVALDASGSTDAETVGFSWQQTDTGGPSVTLSDADTATPSFTAPDVDTETTLTFEVETDDGIAGTDTDTVDVTVQPVQQPAAPADFQVSDLQAPASATQGEIIEVSARVTNVGGSAGTQSVDFRLDTNGDDALDDSETLLSEEVTLEAGADTLVTFDVDTSGVDPGTYTHGVATANDTDDATITVEDVVTNQEPTADAGLDQTVTGGTEVSLDGTDSSDPDEGDTLSYAWEQTAGPDVTLSDADTATPTFTAPAVEFETDFIFELTTTDESGAQDVDSVVVVVEAGNAAPQADAGADQTVDEGSSVELDASGSTDPEGDVVTNRWTQTAGPTVTLSSEFADRPTFTAPTVDTETTLTFEVEARDGNGGVDTDTVDITVVPTNDPPSADAGPDQTVDSGANVQLDATASDDPNSDELSYAWEQVAGAGVTLSDADTATPTFTAPTVDSTVVLVFDVDVSDGNGASATDTVNVTVDPVESEDPEEPEEPQDPEEPEEPTENQPPTADAGENQMVSEESAVTLDASASEDPDDDTLSYAWTQTGGPSAGLSDADTETPTFTAPAVDTSTDLTFSVEVSDGNGATDTDSVTVTVQPVSEGEAFFAVTDIETPDQVTQGDELTLSGTVTNTGAVEATQTVEVRVDITGDGSLEVLRSESLTLESGESETFTATRTVPEDLAPGSYGGGLFTEDSQQTASVEVVSTESESPPPEDDEDTTEDGEETPETGDETYTRDEISQAKYGYDFDQLSTETAREVEELYLRQPFADGLGPADIDTRQELAQSRYGVDFDDLSRESTIEIQSEFDAQFDDTGADAAYTRDDIAQAKYGYDFEDISTETAGQIEELYNRQPFSGDLTPSEMRTREEIAAAEYGDDLDDLDRASQIAVEQAYHAQFAETEGGN